MTLTAVRGIVEAERARFDVPGVAVLVVSGGEVVLAEGFGTRDLGSGAPVTATTMFPLASDTKCFTAALACLLAEEGRLDLDAPVRDVLPWFRLQDPHATELTSCRDLLSHRSGLPGHDLVWYGEEPRSLEELVRALSHLPLSRQPRQSWQYNNLGYSAVGHVTEAVTGLAWSDVLRQLLLEPLGTKGVSLCARDVAPADLALPYRRDRDGDLVEQVLPSRSLPGPPGGLVVSVTDLAPWLLSRLGHEVDGSRVLSDAVLAQLHSPAMLSTSGEMGPERRPVGYALGCAVEIYRGSRLIHHGGNLIGYSSDVAVLPEHDLGVAVLTNGHYSELPVALVPLIVDVLLGHEPQEWGSRYLEVEQARIQGLREVAARAREQAGGRPPSRPVEEFTGTFRHPAYGDLVLEPAADGADGAAGLTASFHGLGDRVRLHHRDRDAFALEFVEFEQQGPLVFTVDDRDRVDGLTAMLEPTVGPIRFARQAPAVTEGLLERIAGVYAHGPTVLTVSVTRDVVSVDVPGFGVVVLTPRGGSSFLAAAIPGVRVEFADDRIVVEPLGVFERRIPAPDQDRPA